MQRARQQLFAGTAFAGDEHCGVGVGDGGDQAAQGLRNRAGTDEKRLRLHAISIVADAARLTSRQKYSTLKRISF